MVLLHHKTDNLWFDVYENNTYIGHIWQRVDKMWLFEKDKADIPQYVLSDVQRILATLNL